MPTISERARELLAAEIEKLTPKGDGRAQILREFDWDNLSWFQQAALRAIESALSSPIGGGVTSPTFTLAVTISNAETDVQVDFQRDPQRWTEVRDAILVGIERLQGMIADQNGCPARPKED